MLKILRKFILLTGADRLVGLYGRTHLSHSWVARLAPPPEFYPKHISRDIQLRGVRYRVQLHDLMSWPLYYGLYMEELDAIAGILKSCRLIVDVGANIGRWSLFAKSVNPQARVVAFEPMSQTFQHLQKNIQLNSFAIEIYPYAIGQVAGQVTLAAGTDHNSGQSKILSESEGQIQMIALDDFISGGEASKIDFIKIDVEGYEESVLRGAEKSIVRDRPFILFEYDDQLILQQNKSPDFFPNFFSSLDYHLFQLPNLTDFSDFTSSGLHLDILACPRERLQEIRL